MIRLPYDQNDTRGRDEKEATFRHDVNGNDNDVYHNYDD